MVSAGFEVTSSESIVELGEFVTSVPPNQFKQLDSAGIQDSLGQLSKHAKEFSRAQKTAIMETVSKIIHILCSLCIQSNQIIRFCSGCWLFVRLCHEDGPILSLCKVIHLLTLYLAMIFCS